MIHATQATKETERIVLAEIKKLPADGSFALVSRQHPAFDLPLVNKPEAAWCSRSFVVQLYPRESGAQRLTVQRTGANSYIRPSRRDLRSISWDDLMAVKAGVGFGLRWAVEVYPAELCVLNDCPMRHLWMLDEAPPFAWKRG